MFKYLWSIISPPTHPVDGYIPDFLEPYVILSGSRRWNVHTKKSDVDLFASDNNLTTIEVLLKNHNIPYKANRDPYSQITKAFVFYLNNLKYELSITSIDKYSNIKKVTHILDSFGPFNKLKFSDRAYRHNLFNELSDYVYGWKCFSQLSKDMQNHIKSHHPEFLV